MMNIDSETIRRVAHLARLDFDQKSEAEMRNDMNRFLEYAAMLDELDISGIEPLVYMNEDPGRLRDDQVRQEISHAEALKNAPRSDSDYFRVAKVIDQRE
ncbi:MAG: Asp-tRNA(Asn)/Glu-tRNA(Gln) amidotransferase subunit GatC [Bacteroidia bacterium]|jgi:aspartyl-tRNA(Asn)/glutamyl-tRNA(Gln) amidotransferase subunit C